MRFITSLLIFLASINSSAAFFWSSLSPEAKVIQDYFDGNSGKEVKWVCGKFVLRYNGIESLSNQNMQRTIRFYGNLEKAGFIIKDVDGSRSDLSGNVSHTFTPTQKLIALVDRRDGDCLFYKTANAKNFKVTQEQKHDRFKQVTIIYATYNLEASPIIKVIQEANGFPTTQDRRVRSVLIVDPFTQKYKIVAQDSGDSNGWWSGNQFEETLAMLNAIGPQALEQLRWPR